MTIDYTTFDADNHYYEATDAFTRHLDPKMARRAMQWAEIDGRQRLLVAGAVNRFIPNPTFDPVAKPGALDEYFRGRNPEGKGMAALFGQCLCGRDRLLGFDGQFVETKCHCLIPLVPSPTGRGLG